MHDLQVGVRSVSILESIIEFLQGVLIACICSEASQKMTEKFTGNSDLKESCLEVKKLIRETLSQEMAIEEALAKKTNAADSPLTVTRLNELFFEAAKITKRLMVAKDQARAAAKHFQSEP